MGLLASQKVPPFSLSCIFTIPFWWFLNAWRWEHLLRPFFLKRGRKEDTFLTLSCINISAIVWLLYLNVHAGIYV